MRFDVVPLLGVGPVRLGMSRDEVRAVMKVPPHEFRKTPTSVHTTDAFHGGFQVFYDGQEPMVDYIELSRDSGLEAFFDGVDVFSVPADELIARLVQRSKFDPNDSELGFSYTFPEWELALWRPVVPEDDIDDDGRYFSTVGIGTRGYFGGGAG